MVEPKTLPENRLKTVHEHALAEDPLRVVRALTARARHGLEPDEGTRAQMVVNAQSLPHLPTERISEELMKIMEADDPAAAIRLAHETGSLGHILPEVENAMDFDQNNPHHEQKLGDHLLSVLERTSKLTRDPDVRLAALLHDIGKPASAWPDPVTGLNHFYEGPNGEGANHEEVGADMVRDRLTSLKGFPANRADRVERLVRNHMFPWFETTKGARRFINQVGDDAEDLLNLREADNGGKTAVYDPRGNLPAIDKQREMIHDVRTQAAPTDRSMLAINGNDLVALGLQGPQIGQELEALTNLVVDDPSLNDRDTLLKMVQEQL
jgi:tRNA nucleotidyltransferase (CCA-adding enzyme)